MTAVTMAADVAAIRNEGRTFVRNSAIGHGDSFFHGRRLDAVDDLRRSFQLRHRVYCEERGFLVAEDYPEGLEIDDFDEHSLHFGSFDRDDELVGTVRLVRGRLNRLPLHEHCPLYPEEMKTLGSITNLTEISRLAVGRSYRRRAADGRFGLAGADSAVTAERGDRSRRSGNTIVLTLYRAIYQAFKQHRIRHVLAAMEPSLRRVLARYHFPFLAIGPAVDYYGPVVPYYLDVDLLDRNLAKKLPELLRYFNDGSDRRDNAAVADEGLAA